MEKKPHDVLIYHEFAGECTLLYGPVVVFASTRSKAEDIALLESGIDGDALEGGFERVVIASRPF